MTEKFWYLKRGHLLARLDDNEIQRLEPMCRIRRFHRRDTVELPAHSHGAVGLLVEGQVCIRRIRPTATALTVADLDPGDLFGELPGIDVAQHEEIATAVEESRIVSFPQQALLELTAEHPEWTISTVQTHWWHRSLVACPIDSLVCYSHRDQVASLLLHLARCDESARHSLVAPRFHISIAQLTNVLDSDPQRIAQSLDQLQRAGHIALSHSGEAVKRCDVAGLTAELRQRNGRPGEQTDSESTGNSIIPFRHQVA